MTFFDFLNLILHFFFEILGLTILDESFNDSHYVVSLGGFLLGVLLLGFVFRFIFALSGLVPGGGLHSVFMIDRKLHKNKSEAGD